MFDYSALTFENHINDNVHDKFNSFSLNVVFTVCFVIIFVGFSFGFILIA